MRCVILALLVLCCQVTAGCKDSAAPAPATASQPAVATSRVAKVDQTNAFFDQGQIPCVRIRLQPHLEQRLRVDPRHYVDCLFVETTAPAQGAASAASLPASALATTSAPAGTEFAKASVKLKGSIGSFRNYDDRPGFTLKIENKDNRFHGMERFHLNNSVQDESYLNEFLGAAIFYDAGYPVARVSHARVIVNQRDLGIYVFKEALDTPFLKRHFPRATGNFYETLTKKDIDADLVRDSGNGPDDLSDLRALVAACREPDAEKRHALIEERLDVERFITFTALEEMLGHWDGYNFNRNNYRLYFRPSDNRAVFIPHGMDSLFRDPEASVLNMPGSIVGHAVLSDPVWNARYRKRVGELLPLFAPEKLAARIDAVQGRLRPVIAAISNSRARQFDAQVELVKSRVTARQAGIAAQLSAATRPK